MIRPMSGRVDRQRPFGVSIVLPTLLRPALTRAVRSVFAQDFQDRIQLLVGIDVPQGDAGQLDILARECPSHIALDVIDPGYSTSVRHGGVHENHVSGSLRTVMTFLANSRYVAYLDDDNWWAPDHLSSLRAAIEGYEWSWSQRWFVEPGQDGPICIDEWESVGIDTGAFKDKFGGFVDPSSLMIDKLACEDAVPAWSHTPMADGRGSDRLVFTQLAKNHRANSTGKPSSYYTINPADILHVTRLRWFRQKGLKLDGDIERSTIAELVADWGGGGTAVPLRPITNADPVFGAVLGQLKPSDALVFGDEDGALAVHLSRTALATGLSCPVVTVGPAKPAAYERLAKKIAAVGLAGSLALMPNSLDGIGHLHAHRVEADLIQLGPGIVGLAALTKIWPLLRLGGFLIGQGTANAVVTRFATEHCSGLAPLKLPHAGPGWIIEKGVVPS